MDFCKEYWVLVSSLEWADKIDGGLKCFNFNQKSEPSIIALKQDLDAICNGLILTSNEKDKIEWSSKLTGIFAWKWLLGCKEFEFLRSLSHFNLISFKDLNLNLCYEIIKSNNWTKHFCNFLQSFNTITYIKLVNHFLRGLLTLDFPVEDDDIKFLVEFAYLTLLSFTDFNPCKNTTSHPLAPIHQPTNVEELAGEGRETLGLFMEILTKILVKQKSCNDSFHLDILLVVTFLNLISAIFLNEVKYISTIDYTEYKTLIFDDQSIWTDNITEFDLIELQLVEGFCFSDVKTSNQETTPSRDFCDHAIESLSNFMLSNKDVIIRRIEDMKKDCKGYSIVDIYLQMLGNLYVNPEQLPIDSNNKDKISTCLEGLIELITDMSCDKQVHCSRDEFQMRKVLLMVENKQVVAGYKNSLLSSLQFQFIDEELRLKQIRCLQENLHIIHDGFSFFEVYKFVSLLQTSNVSEMIVKESKKVILEAYIKLDWSVKDDIIHKLNTFDQLEKIVLVEDIDDLKKRWKLSLNRVSEADVTTRNEMSNIVSLFFLVDTGYIFQNILKEVVAKGNMTRVAAMILGQFPKTLSLRGIQSSIPMFYDTFLSTYSTAKDPKKHLLLMMEFLMCGDGKPSDTKKAQHNQPPFELFTGFSLACIQPMMACGSKSDLSLVLLFLRILTKLSCCPSRHRFVFYSYFVLLCKLLEELHFDQLLPFSSAKQYEQNGGDGSDGGININGGDDDNNVNSIFERKCHLLRVLDIWNEVYLMRFVDDSSLKVLLTKEAKKYSWWTLNHFVGSFVSFNEPILPPCVREHLVKGSSNDSSGYFEEAINTKVDCIGDLIDFVEVSDDCLDWSLNNLELRKLSFGADDDDGGGDDVYDAFMWKVCQKLQFATSLEWMRICSLLVEVAFDEGSSKLIKVCSLVCRSFLLLKVLSDKNEEVKSCQEMIPWNRSSQYLRSFVEVFIERTSLCKGHLEIIKLCGSVCSEVPTQCLIDFMKYLLLNREHADF